MIRIRKYLLSVAAASLLTSLLPALLPKGKIQKVESFIGSLVLILTILSPVVKLNASSIRKAMESYQIDLQDTQRGIEKKSRGALEELISQRCEEYIWDKAAQMGLQLEIEITVGENSDIPVPVSASMVGVCSQEDQAVLSKILEEELGIPRNKQEWSVP